MGRWEETESRLGSRHGHFNDFNGEVLDQMEVFIGFHGTQRWTIDESARLSCYFHGDFQDVEAPEGIYYAAVVLSTTAVRQKSRELTKISRNGRKVV